MLVLGATLTVAALEFAAGIHMRKGLALTVAAMLGSFAVTTWLALGAALLLCAARQPLAKIIVRERWRAGAESIGVFIIVFATGWLLTDPRGRLLTDVYVGIVCMTAFLCTLSHWLTRSQPKGLSMLVCALLVIAAIAADQKINPNTYAELHDLLLVIAISAVTAMLARVPVRRLSAWSSAFAIALVPIVAALCYLLASVIHTGWTRSAILDGSGLASIARGVHHLVDFDRDGFSPLLGGGDCDDFDATRNPLAIEDTPGEDRNCNGAVWIESPSDTARGLSKPFGRPALAPSEIDLFVLITVDCWRADAFDPVLSPRLWAFAQTGTQIERMYSAASETRNSLPLTQRATYRHPFVAKTLQERGIGNIGVSGGGVITRGYGMDRVEFSKDAEETTDLALAQLALAREGPVFLWVHYYDLHETGRFAHTPPPPGNSPLPRSYQAAVFHVDEAAGRLLDTLKSQHRLERAAVLISADHGEGLGDHNVGSHGRSGFESVIRVPGIFVAPSMPARRLTILGSHRDLPATILGAFGLDKEAREAEQLGRSWLRLRDRQEEDLHDFVVIRSARLSSGRRQDDPLAVMVDERYKLVAGVVDGFFSLYDLQEDPGEQRNIADDRPQLVQAMWKKLGVVLDFDGYPKY